MTEYLQATVDKFTFKVATDRFYTAEGMWVFPEGGGARSGVTDYLPQRSGDVAFAEVKPAGTPLAVDDEVAALETIKVNTSIGSPVRGTLAQVNPALADAPERINSDPYGDGWLAVIDLADWDADRAHLLTAQQYFARMKEQAEHEVRKS